MINSGTCILRRVLSISLILLLWLPAVAALMPGAADVRLPFCCRRQGAHHCRMDAMAGGAQNDGSAPAWTAPSRCPLFPASLPASMSPVLVAVAAPADWPALVDGMVSRVSRREAARSGRLRAQLDRGPPSSVLA